MSIYNVHQIETALQQYEQLNLVTDALRFLRNNGHSHRIEDDIGKFTTPKKWHNFRTYILNGEHPDKVDDNEFQDSFCFPEDSFLRKDFSFFMNLPVTTYQWMHLSRAVFHITKELQYLLDGTLLGNVKWSDIKFPFDSFVITLDDPIVIARHPDIHKSTCIMFSIDSGDNMAEFRIFSTTQELPITAKNSENMYDHLRKKNVNALYGDIYTSRILGRLCKEFKSCSKTGLHFFIDTSKVADDSVTSSMASLLDKSGYSKYVPSTDKGLENMELSQRVLQIVCGLCLYLQTIPATSTQRNTSQEWMNVPKKGRVSNNAITNTAKICTVKNVHTISSEEKKALKEIERSYKTGSEKSTHFRRGTWCRKRGAGNDPNAPRVKWRKPTIVRPDRLDKGSIVVGQRVIVK